MQWLHEVLSKIKMETKPTESPATQYHTAEFKRMCTALYELLPDHQHPKTWANKLKDVEGDDGRKVFNEYEWHAAKIVIKSVRPPTQGCRIFDEPPTGKNDQQIVLDHFHSFASKYNSLDRGSTINANAAKEILNEYRGATSKVLPFAAKPDGHARKKP